jgi:hypothetical protein
MMENGKRFRAHPPFDSALAGSGLMGENSPAGLGFGSYPGVALGQESGQLRLDLAARLLREEATSELRAQFVDMIDDAHVRRLRLDDVDAARAREDRVKDRKATGGAGEGRSRFCRPARQNWRSRSSLKRTEQPYPRTSLREENRGPKGDASEYLRRPTQRCLDLPRVATACLDRRDSFWNAPRRL